jgi:hypothetical protein
MGPRAGSQLSPLRRRRQTGSITRKQNPAAAPCAGRQATRAAGAVPASLVERGRAGTGHGGGRPASSSASAPSGAAGGDTSSPRHPPAPGVNAAGETTSGRVSSSSKSRRGGAGDSHSASMSASGSGTGRSFGAGGAGAAQRSATSTLDVRAATAQDTLARRERRRDGAAAQMVWICANLDLACACAARRGAAHAAGRNESGALGVWGAEGIALISGDARTGDRRLGHRAGHEGGRGRQEGGAVVEHGRSRRKRGGRLVLENGARAFMISRGVGTRDATTPNACRMSRWLLPRHQDSQASRCGRLKKRHWPNPGEQYIRGRGGVWRMPGCCPRNVWLACGWCASAAPAMHVRGPCTDARPATGGKAGTRERAMPADFRRGER